MDEHVVKTSDGSEDGHGRQRSARQAFVDIDRVGEDVTVLGLIRALCSTSLAAGWVVFDKCDCWMADGR